MGHQEMKLLTVDDAPLPRRFRLLRTEDVSGVSGVGHVADGVMFYDHTTVIYWRTSHASAVFFKDINDLLSIHGHGGATTIDWIDDD